MDRTPPGPLLAAGVAVFVAVLGAYVALTVLGHPTDGLVNVVVVLLGLVGVGAHSEVRTREQNRAIDKIEHQTNGVLDERIRRGTDTAVRVALREAGYEIKLPPTH